MPKLPDALGAPDQAVAAMQDSASEAAQPNDRISSVLEGASSLYSRFGQGGPPRLTDVANGANDLYGVPYDAGAASVYGYVGNAPLNPVDPSGLSDQSQSTAQAEHTGILTLALAAQPPQPVMPAPGSSPGISLASLFQSQTPLPVTDDRAGPVLTIDGKQMVRPSDVSPNFFVDYGRWVAAADGSGLARYGALAEFAQGAHLDVQRVGPRRVYVNAFKDFANFAIGLYAAAAGIPENETLFIADRYAALKSGFARDQQMDPTYPNMSDYGVYSIKLGYQLYQSGLIGPSHSR